MPYSLDSGVVGIWTLRAPRVARVAPGNANEDKRLLDARGLWRSQCVHIRLPGPDSGLSFQTKNLEMFVAFRGDAAALE